MIGRKESGDAATWRDDREPGVIIHNRSADPEHRTQLEQRTARSGPVVRYDRKVGERSFNVMSWGFVPPLGEGHQSRFLEHRHLERVPGEDGRTMRTQRTPHHSMLRSAGLGLAQAAAETPAAERGTWFDTCPGRAANQ